MLLPCIVGIYPELKSVRTVSFWTYNSCMVCWRLSAEVILCLGPETNNHDDVGMGRCGLLIALFVSCGSMHTWRLLSGFSITFMGFGQSVGLSTFLITPKSSTLLISFFNLSWREMGMCLAGKALGSAPSLSVMWYSSLSCLIIWNMS